MAAAIARQRIALTALAAAAILAALVLCWPTAGDAPIWGRTLAERDLPAITADDAGDRRLLAHFTARLDGRLDLWRQRLPEDAQTVWAGLRLEDVARTDGLALGLAGVERGRGDVEPEDAARAYDSLGIPDAAGLMRSLAAIVGRDGAAWRAALAPGGAPPPAPDRVPLDRIAAGIAGLLPAIRSARLRWIAEHQEAMGLR